MTVLAVDDILLGLRSTVLGAPSLADLPAHLFNTAYTVTKGAYWAETLEILDESVVSMGGAGNHLLESNLEYLVTLVCPSDEGTGRIWAISKEVAALCPPGLGVILAAGQATVMRCERLGPRIEDHDFVMRVRLDVLAYSLT